MLAALAPIIGAGISGITSLLGGKSNNDAIAAANAAALADKEKDRELQREFAQTGIRWKVDDAKAAGIHPLYALGANTVSYSPSSVGITPETGMGTAMASAGQDLSRAINATRTASERDDAYTSTVKNLTLQKMGLENDLLSSQIAKLRASANPPLPGLVGEKNAPDERPKLVVNGKPYDTDPGMSNADEFEKRYGEVSDWTYGPYIMWKDFNYRNRGIDSTAETRRRFGMPPDWVRRLTGEIR